MKRAAPRCLLLVTLLACARPAPAQEAVNVVRHAERADHLVIVIPQKEGRPVLLRVKY